LNVAQRSAIYIRSDETVFCSKQWNASLVRPR